VDDHAVICGNSKCAGFAFGNLPVKGRSLALPNPAGRRLTWL